MSMTLKLIAALLSKKGNYINNPSAIVQKVAKGIINCEVELLLVANEAQSIISSTILLTSHQLSQLQVWSASVWRY
jgi:hypothetical protein